MTRLVSSGSQKLDLLTPLLLRPSHCPWQGRAECQEQLLACRPPPARQRPFKQKVLPHPSSCSSRLSVSASKRCSCSRTQSIACWLLRQAWQRMKQESRLQRPSRGRQSLFVLGLTCLPGFHICMVLHGVATGTAVAGDEARVTPLGLQQSWATSYMCRRSHMWQA